MSCLFTSGLPAALARHRNALTHTSRTLCTSTANRSSEKFSEKRFVRIAGPASYASRSDLAKFLKSSGVSPAPPHAPSPSDCLTQGQSDVFQNQAVWVYDAGSADAAADAAARLTGRIAGLKLVRAAAVDRKIVDGMLAPPRSGQGRAPLRKRMNVIQPTGEEKGRSLLATGLKPELPPRGLWGFFAAYDVVDVKHLRKSCVACIVFASEEEAHRAMRERGNLEMQGTNHRISLKMYE